MKSEYFLSDETSFTMRRPVALLVDYLLQLSANHYTVVAWAVFSTLGRSCGL